MATQELMEQVVYLVIQVIADQGLVDILVILVQLVQQLILVLVLPTLQEVHGVQAIRLQEAVQS